VEEAPGASEPAPEWRHALEALERELAVTPTIACNGVALTIAWEPRGARIVARSADGLETSRLVGSPLALSAVAFGLLAAAPTEPTAPPPDLRDLPPPDAAAPPRARVPPEDLVSHLSVSVASGARAGFPTKVVMADVELRADLFVHSWLVTLSMRATPLAVSPRLADDPDAYDETAIALCFGRELRAGRSAFDLTFGPNLTYIWMENDAANLSTEHAQLRLAAIARWGYGVTSRVRLNVTFDGELAPSGLSHPSYEMGLAPFPAVTLGLRVGAEVAL
jgi:hypothetical protein